MSVRAKGNDREERRKKSQGQDGDWDEGMEIGRGGKKNGGGKIFGARDDSWGGERERASERRADVCVLLQLLLKRLCC